jgi:ketosteroid isomerase-like protein
MSSAEANRALALKFGEAWNTRNMRLFDEIFHPELKWHVAVTPYDQSEPPVFQSPLLRDQKMIWDKTVMDKRETVAAFAMTLAGFKEFSIEITSTTVEGDTVVAESLGRAVNPQNGRVYNNIYCYVMKIRDGRIVLFREYQNTLLVFDVFNNS